MPKPAPAELVHPATTVVVTQECEGGVIDPQSGLPATAGLSAAGARFGGDLSPGSAGAILLLDFSSETADLVLERI